MMAGFLVEGRLAQSAVQRDVGLQSLSAALFACVDAEAHFSHGPTRDVCHRHGGDTTVFLVGAVQVCVDCE